MHLWIRRLVSREAGHEVSASPGAVSRRTDRRVLLNTGALAGSSLWRIGLSFVLQLLIANRLGAQGLGQYTIALAHLNVSQVFSELGLPALLVRELARFPDRRRHSFWLALLAQSGAAWLVWGGLAGLALWLPYEPTTRLALCVIGANLPFYAVTSACQTLFQASERMELVMGVEMTINVLVVAGSVTVLWLGGSVVHLVALLIATQAVSAALCLWLVRRHRLLSGRAGEPRASRFSGLRQLRRDAVPFYGLALANVLLHRLDILLLGVLVGERMTGVYSAAYLIVRVLLVLSQSYWQSLYPTLSRLRHQAVDQYRRLASLGLRYGLVALLPVAALGAGSAEPVLKLVFARPGYTDSVPVFQVLVWAAPFFLISTYAVNLLLVEKLPRHSLMVAGLYLALAALFLPLLAIPGQALGAAAAVLMAMVASAAGGLWLVDRAHVPADLRAYLPQLLFSTAVAGAVGWWLPVAWPLRAGLGTILYLVSIWQTGVLQPSDFQRLRRALQ